MNYIDTSVCMRTITNTTQYVESDIVDASGNYKPFSKYDTLWIPDPSISTLEDPRQLRLTHLYVGENPQEEINNIVEYAKRENPSIFDCPRKF